MHFTRFRDLLLAGSIGFAVGYVLFAVAYGSMQSLPTSAGGTLLVLAVVEMALAIWVRGKIRSARVTGALVIARLVTLAKASSILGATMGGGWLGALVYLLPHVDAEQPQADAISAMVGAVCAVALVLAALWLEHSCRTPEPKDQDRIDDTQRPMG